MLQTVVQIGFLEFTADYESAEPNKPILETRRRTEVNENLHKKENNISYLICQEADLRFHCEQLLTSDRDPIQCTND